MNFSRPFIERPIGTTLLAIGLFLLGAVAYVNLPVASLPSIEFPTIRVNASLPGADAETMAARVAAPLERRLGEIPGVNEMTSVNSLGSTAHLHPVRPHPRHRRRRPGRAGRHQRRGRGPAGRHAIAAELPEIEPVRLADPDPGADLQDHPGQRHVRRRRYRDRPAHLAGRGRGRGDGSRRRAARHPRARQPHAAVHRGPQHRGRAHGHRQRQRPFPARHHRGRQAGDRDRVQRPTAHRRRLQEHHPQDRQRRRRAPLRAWPRSSRARATRARRPCSTTSRRSC